MSDVYQIERLIFWMRGDTTQDRIICEKIRELTKHERAFRWHYYDEKLDCKVSRFVDVACIEELEKEIRLTQIQCLEPVLIFPHSDKTWVHELDAYYLSLDPLFYDDDPMNVSNFILNPSSELYESWASASLEHHQSYVAFDTVNLRVLASVADEFDRWLKSTKEWDSSLKGQLISLSESDFEDQSNGWFVHRSSPLIRYKARPPLEYYGCLPEQLKSSKVIPQSNNWAGAIETTFENILSKIANRVGASNRETQDAETDLEIGKMIISSDVFEPINLEDSPLALIEFEKIYPQIASKIGYVWTIKPDLTKAGSIPEFLKLVCQLKSTNESLKDKRNSWLKYEVSNRETGEILFLSVIDVSSVPNQSSIEKYQQGEIIAYVQRDIVLPIGGNIVGRLSLL